MNLSIGIVGLPNVGKSTLFNALLKKSVAFVANYPFATIDPNVGVVEVPDERLDKLAEVIAAERPHPNPLLQGEGKPPVVPAVVEFYDIAGLVKDASKGQGLGNKFLSHIREVAAIAHVVRLFEDGDIVHVANKVDPLSDIQTVQTELALADLSTVEKQHEPKMNATKEERYRYEVVQKIMPKLNEGVPVRLMELSDYERESLQNLHLLTMKPMLYVFNASEKQLGQIDQINEKIKEILNQIRQAHRKQVQDDDNRHVILNAKLETELVELSAEEQKEYLQQYGLEEAGLNRLSRECYLLLNLISFLTAGEIEVRAWTIKRGTLAPQAAGVIHTDFEKHFIKADIVPYPLFVKLSGWTNAREAGKVMTVGKDYVIKDGDVIEFKVGV